MPAAKSTATKTTAASAGSATSSTRKPRGASVKAEDAVILGSFSKVSASEVPHAARAKGERKNPFDDVLALSYKENDEATDDWRAFSCTPESVPANERLIRSAASFLGVGARILKPQPNDDGTVTLWFRGQEKRDRGPKGPKNAE